FEHIMKNVFKNFIDKYNLDIIQDDNPKDTLDNILSYFKNTNKSLYILIDEYDHFANRLLIQESNNYEELITDKTAFYKEFFTMLKSATAEENSPLRRIFITGVTPMTMYDVTSGFNIGSNISIDYEFNDMVGINQDEAKDMFDHYDISNDIVQDIKRWYNNYIFTQEITHTIFNTDMLLYFLKHYTKKQQYPIEMIDINVRSDYSKLRHLIYTNKKLNGNFDTLRDLLSNNETSISNLVQDFSALNLSDELNFKSLMFYLGLVTIKTKELDLILQIPNETIKRIDSEFVATSLLAENILAIDTAELNKEAKEFALNGDINLFSFLAQKIQDSSSMRDYIEKESHIKAMYITYFSLIPYFITRSEAELNKGFADLFITPFNPYVKYFAIVELKYIKRDTKLTKQLIQEKLQDAKTQLDKYEDDELVTTYTNKGILLKKVALVFYGWELVMVEEREVKDSLF
ncbi:MAG: AAA family ATPase, partial [Campylobacterales bacterium]